MKDVGDYDFIGYDDNLVFVGYLWVMGLLVSEMNIKLSFLSGVVVWVYVCCGFGLGIMVDEIVE